ncbi:MAG TPA: hypothetical protein VMZ00_09245 [Sporichthya sp.]|nr:hypothetical protein [Sporichthya sp.]
MSWDLGDVVPLSITVTDAAGLPANAGQVDLTITLPDGATNQVGPIAATSTGLYDHDFATTQAGLHIVRWVATGVNASAYADMFDVQPAADGSFVSLADVKNHLKTTATVDDEKLRGFRDAACQMIKDRMGHVAPVTLTLDGCGRTIVLERPVVSVTSVVQLPGGDAVPQADPLGGVAGWTLDGGAGLLKLSRSFGQVRVVYRPGRSPLPGNFRLAGLELTAHLWRTSQHNTSGGRPSLGIDETVVPGVSYALPYNVRQLLGLDKRPQEEVLVG